MGENLKLSSITLGVPDSECQKGMLGVMSGINTLTVFPFQKTKSANCVDGKKLKLHRIEKMLPMMEKYQRRLINETVGIFLSLQSSANAEEDNKMLIIKKSREYRSVIQSCIMEIKDQIDVEDMQTSSCDSNESEIMATYNILYKMELVLSLIEIIFIDNKPAGELLNQMLSWIRLHFIQYKSLMSQVLSSDQPHLHPHYWDVCYAMVLQGCLEEARVLLSRHSSFHEDSFLSLDELLRKMPVFQTYGGVTAAEYSVRWNYWQGECKSRLERGEFSSDNHLETICKILCGDENTIGNLVDLMDTWYHVMVSTLLYTNPSAQKYILHSAARDAISLMHTNSQISNLDHLLLAIIEEDTYQVMKLCQKVLDNDWFLAHLSDLLYHTMGHKSEYKYLHEMREFLLLDFGSELVSHPSLWQIGILYIEKSGGAQGRHIVAAVLQRIPLTDDFKARKVIQAASDRELDDVVESVCRVMGRRALSEGRLGAAIWWGVRSKDAAFTSHLAHKILHKYMDEGTFESSSLLDNLGPSMLLSDSLTFLGKYREFHGLYQESKFKEAGSLLVSLISSKLAPEYFWQILLVDALPLLQSPEPVITTDQTYQLMYCLHNVLDKQSKFNEESSNGTMNTLIEKEKEIREALTLNLARSIVEEGSVEY